MKKHYLFLLLLFIVGGSLFAQTIPEVKPKLSPLTKKYLSELQASTRSDIAPSGYLYKKHDDGNYFVSALIQVVNAASVQQQLDALGATVGTKAGNIWTVQVPFNVVPSFCQMNGISYIQMDEPVRPNLDIARKTTRVDSVQKGINLPMKYSGKGVVVGVIDFGFDYNHPTFYDTLHTGYRIKRVWELNSTGTPPAGYTYGNEITDSVLIKAQGTDNSKQTHGTWVAGMAAGSGFGSNAANARFRGMAYEADLVLVGVRRDSIEQQWLQGSFTDFLDGINYIFNYATSVGKPCVVNISWGSHSGPHDGSTLFNQACNNLTGPGKLLVMSAGNEGEEKIHLSKTFTSTDTVLSSFLTFSSNVYKRTWVDVWGDAGKTFCGKVTLYSKNSAGNTTHFTCIDDNLHNDTLISANGLDTCWVQFITSSAESNGKPRMIIDIYSKATDSINVEVKGTNGTINVWDEYYYYGYTYRYQSAFSNLGKSWAVTGNVISTVSDMGAGDSVLLVGAYASKSAWVDINGHGWNYNSYVLPNRLVPFSSRGPLIGGKIKPDITAPGLTIATSVSSYDTSYTAIGSNKASTISAYVDPTLNKTFYYSEFIGTSASAPAASGIAALLLQAKPTLGPTEFNNVIATTAIKDLITGAIPPAGNNNWGHGKINAYGAIRKILGIHTGVYNYTGEKLECELYPNPNNGSFTVIYESDVTRNLTIDVFNMIGDLIVSENWQTNSGANTHPVDLTEMPKGVYLVRVSSTQGFTTIKTIVK